MSLIDIYYKLPYFARYPIFVMKGYFQAKMRYGNGFLSYFKELKANENMNHEEILNIQNEKLRNLLIYSYENVRYYKKIFRASDFNPYTYKDFRDVSKIPILTKDIIRNNYEDLIAEKIPKNRYFVHKTGGTTQEPLYFCLPKELKGPINYATMYRFYSWANVNFRDKRVSIAGRIITKKPPYYMYNAAENQLYVCAHYLNNKKNLVDIIRAIKKFDPSFIQGHPSAIDIMANYMRHENIIIPVKAVFTTSENLYPDQRENIEMQFQTKVFDTYGMGEMVAMASECVTHNGYHLAPEYGYTEIINAEKYESGCGEIISTSLYNYVMPLIRYSVGDIGKISNKKCECGVNFDKLEKISGRIDDVIKLDNGKIILPLSIRIEMKNIGINDFQIIKTDNNSFDVNLFNVSNDKNIKYLENKIRKVLFGLLDNSVNLCFYYDKEPILTKNGKIQMIINSRHY